MMTMTCLIGEPVSCPPPPGHSAASTGLTISCPSAMALRPRRQLCSKRDLCLSRIKALLWWVESQFGGRCGASGQHLDSSHHSPVLMFENVAVVDERADDVRVAKIHAKPHAGIAQ